MDLYEFQARELYAAHGVPVAAGEVADTPAAAASVAGGLGYPCVVKAQVRIGGRGKAGGVKLVHDAAEATAAAEAILGMDIRGHRVDRVMVAEGVDIAHEMYCSILIDRSAGDFLLLFSLAGGIDIEQLANERPDEILRLHFDPLAGLDEARAKEFVQRAGAAEAVAAATAPVLVKLWEVFRDEDATLVEVNPMVVTGAGDVLCIDAKMSLDDNAGFRHPDRDFWVGGAVDRYETRAAEEGLHYVHLDGQVGVLGNGAGLVMSTLDVVAQAGAAAGIHPANFLDIGGGASAAVMKAGLELVLSDQKVASIFVNVFGGITSCDQVAAGILQAVAALDESVLKPIVVRLDGNQALAGRALLERAGSRWVIAVPTMEEGAAQAVAIVTAGAADGTGSSIEENAEGNNH